MASTFGWSSTPSRIISEAPPGFFSSPGWKRSTTVPGRSCSTDFSARAVASRIAVCTSCPQACMTPGRSEAKGSPVSS